jgi:hypothetical protein
VLGRDIDVKRWNQRVTARKIPCNEDRSGDGNGCCCTGAKHAA